MEWLVLNKSECQHRQVALAVFERRHKNSKCSFATESAMHSYASALVQGRACYQPKGACGHARIVSLILYVHCFRTSMVFQNNFRGVYELEV